MYTELTSIEEAVGKTVQSMTRALFGGQMVIAFMDGTFISLGVVGSDYDDSVALQEFGFMDFGTDALLAFGIVTEEERAQIVADFYEERRQNREAAELRQYERLKAKFEGERCQEN